MSLGCKVCQKSFQLVTDLLKHFKVHVHPERNAKKEQNKDVEQQTLKEGTPNLNCENENITIVDNVPKLVESKNENEQFDVEDDVIKTELKVEIGNDSETVVCKRINAEHEVLNVGKTAKSVKIKSEMKNKKMKMKRMKLGSL